MQSDGDDMNGTQAQFDLLKYRPEDGGILDCWLELFGEQWLYVVGYDAWFAWKGTHWAKDEQLGIYRQIQALADAMNKSARDAMLEAYEEAASAVSKDAVDEALKSAEIFKAYVQATKRSKSRVASVEDMARAHRAVAVDQLDAGNNLNLRNGTLNLDTITLTPHSRDDHMTYCLDYDYDENATAPRYEQFLQEVLVHEETDDNGQWVTDTELCMLYQELKGYSLTSDTKFEVMTWLSGDGGNGKSVELATTRKLLGPLCTPIDFQTIGMPGNYELSDIPGRRVILSTESERGGKIAEGIIKRIVSGEPIKARPIYGSQFEFSPVAKVWWAMNDRPVIRDTGNSIWRRLKLIPFNRTFTDADKDPELLPKLEAELSGILNFALDGLRRLRLRGKLPEAAAVTNAISEYRMESNAVGQWMAERTIALPEPKTLSSELHGDYQSWCGQNGREAFNNTNFAKELKRLRVDYRANCRHPSDSKVGKRYALGLMFVP